MVGRLPDRAIPVGRRLRHRDPPAPERSTPASGARSSQAIRLYYEQNAAEENNACSALIMSGVTRTEVVSDSGDELILDVSYLYNNDAHRGSMRCRGTNTRQFTLSRGPNGFQVADMTGERRMGARWRLW